MKRSIADAHNALEDAVQRSLDHYLESAKRGKSETYFGGEAWHLRHECLKIAHQIAYDVEPALKAERDSIVSGIVVSGMFDALDCRIRATSADEISFAADHEHNGLPTFEISAGLMAELLLTDSGKVQELDVPFPFSSFRIVLPNPDCPISFLKPTGGLSRIGSVSVMLWRAGVNRTSLELESLHDSVTLKARQAIANSDGDAQIEANIRSQSRALLRHFSEHPLEKSLVIRAYAGDGSSIFQHQQWGGRTIGEWMDTEAQYTPGGALSGVAPLEDVDKIAVRALQRLVVNLCLYLGASTDRSGSGWSPSSRTIGKRGKTWRIGGEVKVSREIREAATQIAAGVQRDSPLVRHVVRGHFKQQPVGPGRAERRRIYVAPYWRGPLEGPTAPRRYKVE